MIPPTNPRQIFHRQGGPLSHCSPRHMWGDYILAADPPTHQAQLKSVNGPCWPACKVTRLPYLEAPSLWENAPQGLYVICGNPKLAMSPGHTVPFSGRRACPISCPHTSKITNMVLHGGRQLLLQHWVVQFSNRLLHPCSGINRSINVGTCIPDIKYWSFCPLSFHIPC